MGVVKRSISFEAETWDELTAFVAPGEVSAFVNDAVSQALWRERGLAAVAELEAENGKFTEEELAEAGRFLDSVGLYDRRRPR
ncbi:MAG: hypothetical protein ACT4P1_17010 [Sporichthyaceae bacterium]